MGVTLLDRVRGAIQMRHYSRRTEEHECLELRVKDVDFDLNQVLVRRGKGQKDRRTMLPEVVKEGLRVPVAWKQHGTGGRPGMSTSLAL